MVYESIDDFQLWLTPKLARFVTPRESGMAEERAKSLRLGQCAILLVHN